MSSGKQLPLHVDGTVDPKFQTVYNVFRQNFENGLEKEGAAFALYHNGELVVDAWGGYMDRAHGRKWEKDTVAVAMSCTKAVTAIVLAMMVDKGLLNYDELVTKYWPEFGQHGKEDITVKMLLSHQAGLPAIDSPLSFDDVANWRQLSAHFEKQKPFWKPGSAYGYHAITYGFLAEQLLRRVDENQRSIGRFLSDEITSKNGIDFHIGFSRSEWYRLARTNDLQWNLKDLSRKFLDSGTFSAVHGVMFKSNWELMKKSFAVLNDSTALVSPNWFELEIPAANGVGTARGLAKILSLVSERKLLSDALISRLAEPLNSLDGTADCVLGLPQLSGWGFNHSKCPKGNHYLFGHSGYGGNLTRVDCENKIAYAYLHNGLEIFHEQAMPMRTVSALQDAIYACIS